MKIILVFALTLLLLGNSLAAPSSALQNQRPKTVLLLNPLTNVEAAALDSLSLLTWLEDSYQDRGPHPLPLNIAWNFFLTFNLFLWPHEMGHVIRYPEFGNRWWITELIFPRPNADVEWSATGTSRDRAMGVLAGMELTHLMSLHRQKQIYAQGRGRSSESVFMFLSKFSFPFYALVLDPVDTGATTTWQETTGDPTEYVLYIYKHYFGKDPVVGSTIDPWVINFYNEALLASAWGLLDPLVWSSFYHLKDYTFNNKQFYSIDWFKLGKVRWMYGTAFNLSPLGYELYLNLYAHLAERFGTAYLRWGRPFKNYGGGFELNDLISRDQFSLGVGVDVWDQAQFGGGGNAHLLLNRTLNKGLGLTGKLGWKNEGYLIGQPQAGGWYMYGGLAFFY